MGGRPMALFSTVPAMEGNTGQSYLPAGTSRRSPISVLFPPLSAGPSVGEAIAPLPYSRPQMEDSLGRQFLLLSHNGRLAGRKSASPCHYVPFTLTLPCLHRT